MTSLAILGASSDASKISHQAVLAARSRGVPVFPVNPREAQIGGVTTYPSLRHLPQRPGVISVYLPPAVTRTLLPDLAAVGCDEVWLNPGADTPEVVAAVAALGLRPVRTCTLEALRGLDGDPVREAAPQ